ncbi:zinc finger MYM-type protein 1-like [Heracleum sosnowskyi]|uniref:Zinc finger MYM-type protein 1-like n=1 Tax=Heracleum sosnowskyi TaxID=360622 RepID=A0AAD8GR72_9APIA|nr:zinc finger MYM-type protein 1-like [Heracleum sosnowskyi]
MGTLEKYFPKRPRNSVDSESTPCSTPVSTPSISTPNTTPISRVITTMESDIDGIESDPGLRKPIEDYDIGIRDRIRREYISKGACQPKGHNFPKTKFGPSTRTFREQWFKLHDWLEYSIDKDAAFCFYCYLFKPPSMIRFGDDAFTKVGFKNWKKACEKFRDHIGEVSSPHHETCHLVGSNCHPQIGLNYHKTDEWTNHINLNLKTKGTLSAFSNLLTSPVQQLASSS